MFQGSRSNKVVSSPGFPAKMQDLSPLTKILDAGSVAIPHLMGTEDLKIAGAQLGSLGQSGLHRRLPAGGCWRLQWLIITTVWILPLLPDIWCSSAAEASGSVQPSSSFDMGLLTM